MTYIEWIDELKSYLLEMPQSDRQKVIAYFAEMYADKRDAGFSENEIIKEFGAPYDAAKRILSEDKPLYKQAANSGSRMDNADKNQPKPQKNNKNKVKKTFKLIVISVAAVLGVLLIINVISWATTPNFVIKTFTASTNAQSLNISGFAGEIKTQIYDGEQIVIEYPYSDRVGYSAFENDGKVTLSHNTSVFWFNAKKMPETVIKIPQKVALNLDATIDAGTFYLCDGQFGTVNLDLNAGSVHVGEITCANFDCDIDAGQLEANGVICEYFSCDIDAGEANLKSVECNSTEIEVDAGSMEISRCLTDNIKISVNAGEAKIAMVGNLNEYTVKTQVSVGSCNLNPQTGTTKKTIDINVSVGDVTVMFTG